MEEQQIYNFLKKNNLLNEAKKIFETYNNLKKRKSPTLDDLVKEKLMLYSNTSTAPLASLVMLTDWIDEYCDLTFDTLVEHFGQNIIEKDYLQATIKPC